MRVVVIDDEALAIEELKYYLKDYDNEIINIYRNPAIAIENILEDRPDVIFVDMEMPYMNGVQVAKRYQKALPNIIIIFVTAYSDYALDAYKVHPIDYILKPIRKEFFENTMNYIENLYGLITQKENKKVDSKRSIMIQCFGKFEVKNTKGIVMKFTTKKAKELFSYMLCNMDKPIYRDEVLNIFLDNNDDTSKALNNYYVSLYRLRNSLTKFGFTQKEIEIKENCNIYIADGICDFVDLIQILRKTIEINESNIEQITYFIEEYDNEIFGGIDKEWIDEMRDWLEVQMENLIMKASLYLRNSNEFSKAENILEKLIKINPYSVLGYETLLDLYLLLNQTDSFRLLYKKYSYTMKAELGLDVDSRYANHPLLK